MRLLFFSDIHSDHRALERLMATEADYYIAAGDLVSWARGLDRAGEIMKPKADRVFVIPGNHESPADIAALCAKWGFSDLHGVSRQFGHWHVAGLGCSSPTPFNTPGEYTEEEIARRLEPFAALDPLILVCHCPPKPSRLDQSRDGQHFGSTSVAAFIAARQPRYFFCGHIHEAEGVTDQLGATTGVNVGKAGYLLDLAKL
jgi:Icc-related predicted phosphoesterase